MRRLAYPVAALLFACLSASSAYACCETEEKEIKTKCTTDQTAAGKSQADAEKSCKCGYDLMRSKLKDDSIVLFAAMIKGDDGVKTVLAQKGADWLKAGMLEISTVTGEIDKVCETEDKTEDEAEDEAADEK
jgi:hypothetical protein